MRERRSIWNLLFVILSLFSLKIFSQEYNPASLIGGVTDHSARLGFFAYDLKGYVAVYPENSPSEKKIIPFSLDSMPRTFLIIDINNLAPGTKYNYAVINGEYREEYGAGGPMEWFNGSFKTFPPENKQSNFTFVFGSCSENYRNDSVFVEMQKHQPDFFLHLGDWNYPDNEEYPQFPKSGRHRFFLADWAKITESFLVRYSMLDMKKFLQSTPVDYVFDDDDGVWDDFSKHSYCDLQLKDGKTIMKQIPFPDSLRTNLLASYHQYFPGYTNPSQPKEAYHSFVYGNTEVFFLDTRSTRSPNSEVFHQNKKGVWKFKAPAQHEVLDSVQLNWLLTGLKNSKADWKIIVSGTSFNMDYKRVLDICMLKPVQNRMLPNKMTGVFVAGAMSAMWFSFPATQGKLINFCHDNKIRNVFVCSGDAHTSAIDDGRHSGFPEIMSANLAQENTKFASILENNLRLDVWNQGGQGIHNNNFNDAFGKVEVFGKDSVRLSAIDKYGTLICSYILKDGFIPKKYNMRQHSKITAASKLRAFKNLLKIASHLHDNP